MKLTKLLFAVVMSALMFSGQADHIIFNKIITYPDQAEMIEIYNPTDNTINLENYYITDATSTGNYYFNLPSGSDYWSGSGRDFIAKFPNISIPAGDNLSISIITSEAFFSYFGNNPDLSLTEDMLSVDESESTIGLAVDLKDSKECLILFYWDGESELVQDVDYFIWGSTTYGVSKTTDDGYLDDTPLEQQLPIRAYFPSDVVDSMYVRVSFDEIGEIQENGNGITGHNEMSEDFTQSWEIVQQYELIYGCTDAEAVNYNPEATVDDGNCLMAFPNIINGEYDCAGDSQDSCPPLSESSCPSVTTSGLIVDYFDVTVYNGPHAITIEDSEGYRLEMTVWPDQWDIVDDSLSFLIEAPFDRFEVKITGNVFEYQGEKQLLVCGSEYLEITKSYDTEGYFSADTSIIKAEISPAPFVIIPSLGEHLDYTYSFPSDSRVIIRIYDISGRFITSLVDKYYEDSGTVSRHESKSSWDGRDHLGQIVPPGTYLMHIEAMNFQNGKTTTDVAPIVVGVQN